MGDTIGFGFRGVGFFQGKNDEIDNFAYAWPIWAIISAVVTFVALGIALVTWLIS